MNRELGKCVEGIGQDLTSGETDRRGMSEENYVRSI